MSPRRRNRGRTSASRRNELRAQVREQHQPVYDVRGYAGTSVRCTCGRWQADEESKPLARGAFMRHRDDMAAQLRAAWDTAGYS